MVFTRWTEEFRRLLGDGGIPNTYLALDIESTGYDMKIDVVTEIGHVLVQDGKVVDKSATLLDWTDHSVVDYDWLRRRLASLNMQMQPGVESHISIDSMRQRGVPPGRVFELYLQLLNLVRDKGIFVVGHNHVAFDEKMLKHNVVGFGYGDDFDFGPNVFDVHAVERAHQLADDDRTATRSGESVREYMKRMAYMKPRDDRRVTSNLTPFCFKKYRLAERFGLDIGNSHRACDDAMATHLIVQVWREALAKALPSPTPGVTTHKPVAAPASPPAPARETTKPRRRVRGQRNR